jgi:multidrug resistance efflux pump
MKRVALIAVLVTAVLIATAGIALAARGSFDRETPITGTALTRASEAALAATGGGRVTETEIGDEDSYYEVEVTLVGGGQVDVQLDRTFTVVSTKGDSDSSNDRDGDSD